MEESGLVCEEFKEKIVDAYYLGFTHMGYGNPYNPPSNPILRRAYAIGWAEAIMGTVTPEEEVIEEVLGCPKE